MVSQEFQETLEKIDNLDLEMVKKKLYANGWSSQRVNNAEMWYRRFLKLRLICGKKVLVPTEEIDEMWHAHILDTFKYHEDCQHIFGQYLHHYPYFGLRGPKDAAAKTDAFYKTMELFKKHFGDIPLNQQASGWSSHGMDCA